MFFGLCNLCEDHLPLDSGGYRQRSPLAGISLRQRDSRVKEAKIRRHLYLQAVKRSALRLGVQKFELGSDSSGAPALKRPCQPCDIKPKGLYLLVEMLQVFPKTSPASLPVLNLIPSCGHVIARSPSTLLRVNSETWQSILLSLPWRDVVCIYYCSR